MNKNDIFVMPEIGTLKAESGPVLKYFFKKSFQKVFPFFNEGQGS